MAVARLAVAERGSKHFGGISGAAQALPTHVEQTIPLRAEQTISCTCTRIIPFVWITEMEVGVLLEEPWILSEFFDVDWKLSFNLKVVCVLLV